MTTRKIIALTILIFVGKVMSLLFSARRVWLIPPELTTLEECCLPGSLLQTPCPGVLLVAGPMDILYHIPIKIPGSWREPCGLYEQFGPRESSDLLEAEGTPRP